MVVGGEEAYRERTVVARLLDSTNAAGQRLPYMANISHHVMLGARLTVTLSLLTQNTRVYSPARHKQVVGPDAGILEAVHNSVKISPTQAKSV